MGSRGGGGGVDSTSNGKSFRRGEGGWGSIVPRPPTDLVPPDVCFDSARPPGDPPLPGGRGPRGSAGFGWVPGWLVWFGGLVPVVGDPVGHGALPIPQ